jgi:hypothetical protein
LFKVSTEKGKERQTITRVDSSDSDELSLVKEQRRRSMGASSSVKFLMSSDSESSMDDLVLLAKSRPSSIKVMGSGKNTTTKSRILSSSEDDDLPNLDIARQFTSKRNSERSSLPSSVRKSTVTAAIDLTTSPIPVIEKSSASAVRFVFDSDASVDIKLEDKTARSTGEVFDVCLNFLRYT